MGKQGVRREYPVAEALDLLESGLSLTKTAAILQCPREPLARAIRKIAPNTIPAPTWHYIPEDLKREAVERFYLGEPAYKVGASIGVADMSILRWASSGLYE